MMRWRFLVKTVGTQTASSMAKPTNQRKSMLYWICSMSQALGAHAVEHLQEHGAQELLRGDGGAPALVVLGVHASKQAIHALKGRVDHGPDGSQRMGLGHEVFELLNGEQRFGEGVGAAHEGLNVGMPSAVDWHGGISAA